MGRYRAVFSDSRHGRGAVVVGIAGFAVLVLGGMVAVGSTEEEEVEVLDVVSSDVSPLSTTPAQEPRSRVVSRVLADVLPHGASGSLAVAAGDDLVDCRGFGLADHEGWVRSGCDTVFDIGSITKQFTAAAVLRLEMDGKLSTSDRITSYLANVPADKRGITVHELLTHTSGLTASLGGDYEPLGRHAMLRQALAAPLLHPPGARYLYSNTGYSVLAAIVEKVSGQDYEQYLHDELFAPAGMTSTGYLLPDWQPGEVAVEYDARGRPQGTPLDHPWEADGPYWNLRGNGGILSTARDMFRWHVALLGDDVLDAHAKAELFHPYVPEEPGGDSRSGYGWVILPTSLGKVAWHNGGNGWSYAEITRVLGQSTMVFWVTNRVADADAGWNMERRAQLLTQRLVLAETLRQP